MLKGFGWYQPTLGSCFVGLNLGGPVISLRIEILERRKLPPQKKIGFDGPR